MMRAAKHTARESALTAAAGDAACQILGLTIIALVPALFWTGIAAAIGTAIGQPLSAVTLATVGAAIATFLFTAVSTLFARAG